MALGAVLAPLLSACKDDSVSAEAPSLPTIQASVANNTITLTINANSPLAAVGSAALVQYSNGALLVAHTAPTTFVALTAICTHQGCTITGFKDGQYVCPCHGSRYNTSGQVVQGPAQASLRSYPTRFENDQLTITLQ
jgi:Rieske Fe-S protein